MSKPPEYYAEGPDPGTYEKRWTLTEEWSRKAKSMGCNVTRTEIEGDRLTFSGWRHPADMPPTEGIRFDEEFIPEGQPRAPGLLPPEFQATIPEMNQDTDMDPFPAISPNRMYGDCLRYVYKDGRYVLQQKWIIPGDLSLSTSQLRPHPVSFEWRDVETADATKP